MKLTFTTIGIKKQRITIDFDKKTYRVRSGLVAERLIIRLCKFDYSILLDMLKKEKFYMEEKNNEKIICD